MKQDVMTPERWSRIESVYLQALEVPVGERAAFLELACEGDSALAEEVASLLEARDGDSGLLNETAVDGMLAADGLREGQLIGRYRVLRQLGRGGMGEVVLAERQEDGFRQQVALKVIRRGPDDGELLHRFRTERQILASLNHPNIAHLLDVGQTDSGRPFLAMEYVDGLPLVEYSDSCRLSVEERLRIFRVVCAAVHHAHQNLVVHRDLKPSNILVAADGTPKLLDFGIAKLLNRNLGGSGPAVTRLDVRVLTPEYASPEQIRGGPVGTASDVYSLGVLLYELLTGHRPYEVGAMPLSEIERLVCDTEPERPSTAVSRAERVSHDDGAQSEITPEQVSRMRRTAPERLRRRLSGDLDNIVLMAMRKEPQLRYASAERLAEDIGRHLEGLPVHARPATMRYRARKFVRRHAVGVVLAASAVALLVTFSITTALQSARVREQAILVAQERDRAEEVASFLKELFQTADPSETAGSTVTARELLDRGAAKIDQRLGGQPVVQAEMMGLMSDVYLALGLFDESERLGRRGTELLRTLAAGDDERLAASLVVHARALHSKGEYQAAEQRYREALSMQQRLHGEEHNLVAVTTTYLGAALYDQGDEPGAEQLYRKSIETQRRHQGGQHADLATSLNNLGVLLRRRGDLAEAEAAHREALAIRRSVLGDDHPDAIQSLNNVAVAVGSSGDLDSSEQLLREVLERWRRVLGNRHPRVADALINLAGVHMRRAQPDSAEALYREALSIRRERYGDRNGAVAQAIFNLGVALQERGERSAAAQAYREALGIRVALYGEAHRSVQSTREALAALGGSP